MKKYLDILLAFFIVGLTGCEDYNEVKATEIEHAFISNSSANFKGYFYQGSDNTYHYFVSKWDFQKDKYFKFPIDKLKIENKYKADFGDKELLIDLYTNDYELFGQNRFYKLFVSSQQPIPIDKDDSPY